MQIFREPDMLLFPEDIDIAIVMQTLIGCVSVDDTCFSLEEFLFSWPGFPSGVLGIHATPRPDDLSQWCIPAHALTFQTISKGLLIWMLRHILTDQIKCRCNHTGMYKKEIHVFSTHHQNIRLMSSSHARNCLTL